ncbi:H-type lectin domain-containing protein [Aspergillus glaucus CBS 516.65]|uniref:H-type lectin domain-containing protein n=1 Tax=Aspergillus glaucus CBS 516.65 TaxID=1160497 RepID=A0A1L9V7T2_ASPGL|nr:hypothetical protein ASPGLDRAFT_52216 [Aspergillus glaucus CBS 516.65]OJJ79971.1 hypothetical protein ASPGLDRAFT_52216 [Aspergillus glaucus CBS 516.65]
MIYPIFPGWAENIKHIDWPNELSEPDKMLIGRIYRPIMPTTLSGRFRTQESREWYKPAGKNVKNVLLQNPFEKHLELTIGITHFDLARDQNMHLKAYADAIEPTSFNLHIDSMDGTTQYSAAADVMVTERYNPTLQTGSYTTSQEHKSGNMYSTRINFATPFKKQPRLVVWLQAFEFGPDGDYNLFAYAKDIKTTGFCLRIETWDNAKLKSAQASWIAYEEDPPGFHSSRVTFYNFEQGHGDDKRHRIENEELGEWQLRTVYAAISKFSFASPRNIRFSLETRHKGNSAFEIDAKTWADSVCREIEVSYLADCI